MNTTLPIIALDVDGVISPLGGQDHFPEAALVAWNADDLIQAKSSEAFGLYAVKPVLDFLSTVHNDGRAAIHWHTSWRTRAPKILAPDFKLPEWPLLNDNGAYHSSKGWWKLDTIEATISEGHRVIWLDDDVSDAVNSGEIGLELTSNKNLHIVSPDVMVGLTQTDLNSIDVKLKEWGF